MSSTIELVGRPYPPARVCDENRGEMLFVPAHDLADWVKRTFIGEGLLYNPDHDHLLDAELGFIWTNVECIRQGREVVGTCEIANAHGGKWTKGREAFQLAEWFGVVPDFVITLDAVHAGALDDGSFCALVEHELYHAGQAYDKRGEPRFDRQTGAPVYCLRGHDVEEFVGVVARYGAGAASTGVLGLVEAASMPPLITPSRVSAACGNCLR
jgi:hypothetical protein